jgi:predicted transcriptional regulator
VTSTSESPGPALPQMSPSTHVKMTADIATSYLGNNSIAPERVKDVILSIHDALREVHTTASVGAPSLKDEITSSVAALAAPAPQPAPVAEAPRASAPAPAVADAPAAQASAPAGRKAEAPKAEASKSRRGGRASAVTVPEPLADGGRVRRQPRLRTVGAEASAAPAPAPVEVAEAAAAKLPETPWAATHLGLQPTYAPRSAKEVEKIRKAVFVNDYEGKTGGFVRCLEDGQIRRMLKKHLKFLEIPPAEYLAKWGLPADFPLVHPDFSASRANQIKTAGLWEQRRSVRAKRGEQVDFEEMNVKERQRAERAARRTSREAA